MVHAGLVSIVVTVRKNLKIAIDGRPALRPRTGVGVIVHNVLRKIAAIDRGPEYFFYFDSDPGERISEYSGAAIAFGGPSQELLWTNTFLARQLRRDGIDVYVSFLEKEVPFFRGPTKYISMVHDLIPLRFPEVAFRNAMHALYYRALIRTSVRASDIVLTNSDYSRQEIVSTLHADPGKVRKIVLGVEPAVPLSESRISGVLEKYRIRKPYLFALGSTEPRKNNARVIEAFRGLERQFPELGLVIGGGEWRGQRFDPALLDDRTRIIGFIDDADLPALYHEAALFVFPSLHEGFGFPVIEAMTYGTPVITSRVAALPESGGLAALYCDPYSVEDLMEKIRSVLTQPGLSYQMRAAGAEHVAGFRWETTCRQVAAACAEVAAFVPAPRRNP
jgi:alpha-1,3-rhamnosyl/mannosyltransferase